MADFEAQVNGLTNLSIGSSSTNPGQTELSTFLKDAVVDVTNRCLTINPMERDNFSRESSEQTSNGLNVGSNEIISVLRENGSNNQWYPCRRENIGLQYKVTDTSSLHYASKYNPVYMITQNRNIHVYPEPSASGNDTFKVLYVNYDPEESDGTNLQHDSTGIKWFPDDKVYLVVLYAAIQSLQSALAAKSLPDDISFPSIPSSLSLSDTPVIPALSDNSVSFSTTAPTYSGPTVVPNFGDAENWISVEEDPEMLAGRIQTINAQIGEFQAKVQDSVQSFNKENVEYQAQLQIAIQNAQLSQSDDSQKLQKYSAEITSYQQDNQSKIAKFNADLQSYTSEVSSKLQDYTSKIQKAITDYGWMESRAKLLMAKYEGAFVAMAGIQPKQQQAAPQQVRR